MAPPPPSPGQPPEMNPADIIALLWKRYAAGVTPIVIVILLMGVGAWTSVYTVATEGEAVVKRFGRVARVAEPGLNFKLPFFIETATFVPTERVLKEEFGFRTVEPGQRTTYTKTAQDLEVSLMLTGDLNVIDVEWVVQYQIADPVKFLHSVRAPVETLRDIAEATMRQIVGNRVASDVLTIGRTQIAVEMKEGLTRSLDAYDIGIAITSIELQDVLPPERVKPAFDDVNAAQQERERLINEAERSRNQVLARAEGEALQLVAQAEGYAAERVNTARGQAERYLALLEAYEAAPQVTRQRMFLEAIDDVLPAVGQIYVIEPGQTGPLPLLNLGNGQPANATKGGSR
ncbi:FtsH protease activity modulator HflK [Mucisphaera calidilacus]|uniref:Protein HflK n=1 Tax=Mucisphaera calidilacus TaxID=2527982 RepID=A0A518BXP3_9BACT|nr:FtsH protease activity modulator HflK [Mucisphaera calidilacus]QDU71724.1 Modulator of FtsH protease HflK [Mucisphaera calidilacus]